MRPFPSAPLFLPVCLIAAACSEDPLPPLLPEGCDSPRACQVEGTDLVVEPARILAPAGQPTDGTTGYHVFQPGAAIEVEVQVWNRGSLGTQPIPLHVFVLEDHPAGLTLQVPALQPGEIWTDTAALQLIDAIAARRDQFTTWSTLDHESRRDDPVFGNDEAAGERLLLAVPVPQATLTLPDSVLQLGEPTTIDVVLTNQSRHGALPAGEFLLCLIDFDIGCGLNGLGSPFAIVSHPAIAPGGSWTTTMAIEVPGSITSMMDAYPWDLAPCIAPAGTTLQDAVNVRYCVPGHEPVEVRPNYPATCGVLWLQPDTTVAVADAPLCTGGMDPAFGLIGVSAAVGDTLLFAFDHDHLPLRRGDGTAPATTSLPPVGGVEQYRVIAADTAYFLTLPIYEPFPDSVAVRRQS